LSSSAAGEVFSAVASVGSLASTSAVRFGREDNGRLADNSLKRRGSRCISVNVVGVASSAGGASSGGLSGVLELSESVVVERPSANADSYWPNASASCKSSEHMVFAVAGSLRLLGDTARTSNKNNGATRTEPSWWILFIMDRHDDVID
jgi:hypothetical protein